MGWNVPLLYSRGQGRPTSRLTQGKEWPPTLIQVSGLAVRAAACTCETECATTSLAGLGHPSDRLTQVTEDPPTLPGGAQLAICLTWVREGPPTLPGESWWAA